MCYRPIHIYNPSRKYREDMPKKIAVPCGRCADCQRNKRNEWFFRSMVEYNRVRSVGGAVYFVTFTYNDDNLPTFILPDGSVIKGFSKRHIHNFIKYFRILLKKNHLDHKGMKYLICSEYGEHTQRPHYHGLLFMNYHVPLHLLNEILRTAWHYGFVVIAKQGLEVVSAKGIRYASKYICKDMSFEKLNPSFERFLDCDFAERKARLEPYKEFMPRHWQSIGFGESWLVDLEKRDDIAKYLAENRVELELGKHDVFKIPRYYHLKTEKQINKYYSLLLDKVVIEPTELGKEVAKIRLENRIPADIALLRGYTSSYLNVAVPCYQDLKDILEYFRVNYPTALYFRKHNDLSETDYNNTRSFYINLVSEMSMHMDMYKFAVYRCFLRDLPIFEDENPVHKFSEVGDIVAKMVCSDSIPPEIVSLYPFLPSDKPVATPLKDCPNLKRSLVCRYHPFFAEFEKYANAIDWLDEVSNIRKEYATIFKQKNKERVKNACPNIPTILTSF